jgi:signal transduction histidine kinase
VPQRVREHLFEAFRGSARSGGTGLGLNIARELARAHGGDIQLVSEAGSGAVFRLAIPDRVSELRPGRRGQKLA